MKKDIHPKTQEVLFCDKNAEDGKGVMFMFSSTISTSATETLGEKKMPYVSLDISSASHPAYTGKKQKINNEGRIGKFNRRYPNNLNVLKATTVSNEK